MLADLVSHTAPRPPPCGWRRRAPTYDALALLGAALAGAACFGRIAQDAPEQDRALIGPFRIMAERVLQADEARLRFLLYGARAGNPPRRREAAQRVAENRCPRRLGPRGGARALPAPIATRLERLAVEAPQRDAIEPERALAALDDEIATLDALPVGALGRLRRPDREPARGGVEDARAPAGLSARRRRDPVQGVAASIGQRSYLPSGAVLLPSL